MRVNREELLRALEAVSPGLATKEIIEQSACFCFTGDMIKTFNDEIACSRKSPVSGLQGAVQASPLLTLLSKLSEEEIDLEQKDGQLLVKGKSRRAGINMEQSVTLPIDVIEEPGEWKPLDPEVIEGVSIVQECASQDDGQFALTCLHLTATHIEATDNFQIVRYPVTLAIEQDMLVRRDAIKCLIGLDMTEFSESSAWLHFRNPAGLVISCRRYLEEYPELTAFLEVEGSIATLPGGLVEAIEKAEIFSSENAVGNKVLIDLQPGKLLLEGRGANGWFQERRMISYAGEPLKFMIAPKLLVSITQRANDCTIGPGRLLINSGRFKFVGCLSVAE